MEYKIGLIINPIAGMGGKVGLKGTDGEESLRRAIDMGAEKEAPNKAIITIKYIIDNLLDIEIVTFPGDMGENECNSLGIYPTVLTSEAKEQTTYKDTEDAAVSLADKVDLILFAGGDGTARNIYNSIKTSLPAVGIPAGVKIHSAVFATNPTNAGKIVVDYFKKNNVELRESEVMDIDEELFREGYVAAKLYGYLNVPYKQDYVQSLKSGSIYSDNVCLEGIADYTIERMENNTIYLIGSGTTTKKIMEKLNLPYTLLGIDIIKNEELLYSDANEEDILRFIENQNFKIIVSLIGGQGFIFGRGNQQLSHKVIKKAGKKNIIIIASPNKILGLKGRSMLVDTGDEQTDKLLSGYYKVTVGYEETYVYRCN